MVVQGLTIFRARHLEAASGPCDFSSIDHRMYPHPAYCLTPTMYAVFYLLTVVRNLDITIPVVDASYMDATNVLKTGRLG